MYSTEENKASWDAAKQFCKYVGDISTLYYDAIRAVHKNADMLNAHTEYENWPPSMQPVTFLLQRSPTLRNVFYLAAKELYAEELIMGDNPTIKEFIKYFTSDEMTAILSTTLLYRRVKKQLADDEWERLEPILNMHLKIGALVGDVVDGVGRGHGISLAALSYLGYLVFAVHDLKTFQSLRRQLDKSKYIFDSQRETSEWGCNHLQIAAVIAQRLGFMKDYTFLTTSVALLGDGSDGSSLPEQDQRQLKDWQAAIEIIESLHKNLTINYRTRETDPIFDKDAEEIIISTAQAMIEENESLEWFNKTTDEIDIKVRFG